MTARWLTRRARRQTRATGREHLRKPVRFAPAVARCSPTRGALLLEVGPRATLSALARQGATASAALPVGRPEPRAIGASDEPEPLRARARAAVDARRAIDWPATAAHERRRRVAAADLSVPAPAPLGRCAAGGCARAACRRRCSRDLRRRAVATPSSATAAEPTTAAAPPRRGAPARAPASCRRGISGIDVERASIAATPWLELGLDSLTLTQLALQLQRSSRQGHVPPVMETSDDRRLASTSTAAAARRAGSGRAAAAACRPIRLRRSPAGSRRTSQVIVSSSRSCAAARRARRRRAAPVGRVAGPAVPTQPLAGAPAPTRRDEDEPPPARSATTSRRRSARSPASTPQPTRITPQQRARLDALIARYTARTGKSKAYTAKHRAPHGRSARGQRLPAADQGADLPDRDRALARLAPVGHRRQRVRRRAVGLRHEPVRLAARLHARGAARAARRRLRDRPAARARRRGRASCSAKSPAPSARRSATPAPRR